MGEPRIVALIPARAGSVRVQNKNTRPLNGHPLLAYAIGVAQEAGIFESTWVSSDSLEVLDAAARYADIRQGQIIRPSHLALDDSPDIEWVTDAMDSLEPYDAFAIIRPTSPFRRGPWIRKAWEILQACPRADSIRAVRPCGEHPAKMWRRIGITETQARYTQFISPVLNGIGYEAPWHSMPTQLLPTVYTQTAALEIAWTRVLPGSISGQMVLPYFTERDAPEAIDINEPSDFELAERLAAEHPEWLPSINPR